MATGTTESRLRQWSRRVGWLVAIWAASVAALFLTAALLRCVMTSVGLSA